MLGVSSKHGVSANTDIISYSLMCRNFNCNQWAKEDGCEIIKAFMKW